MATIEIPALHIIGYTCTTIDYRTMSPRPYLCLLICLLSLKSAAQHHGYDTIYVKENYNQLCATLIAENSIYELTVQNKKDSKKQLAYQSNSPVSYGFGLDYKWLTFSYTYAFSNLNKSILDGGFTEVRGISLGITSNKFWCRAFLQSQRGMYLSNADIFQQPELINTKRNDINGSALFGNFNYIFNHKRYSHNATMWQIDQQLKSAGTFTAGLAVALYATQADSSLVPHVLASEFNADDNVKRSATQSYALTGGYMRTFVIAKRVFIHLGVIPGICLQRTSVSLSTGANRSSDFIVGGYSEARGVIGYNGKKFYGGVNVVSYFFTEDRFDAALSHNYSFTRLFIGMRLPLKVKVPLEKYF